MFFRDGKLTRASYASGIENFECRSIGAKKEATMYRKLLSWMAGGLLTAMALASWPKVAAADEPRSPVVPAQAAIGSSDHSVPIQLVDRRRWRRDRDWDDDWRGRSRYYYYPPSGYVYYDYPGSYYYPRYRYYSYPQSYYPYGYSYPYYPSGVYFHIGL
jgi:hypothetical protein